MIDITLKHLNLWLDGMPSLNWGGNVLIDIGGGRVRWIVVVPDLDPKNPNKLSGQQHWALTKEKDLIFSHIHAHARAKDNGPMFPTLFGKCDMRIYRIFGKGHRKMDKDNLVASMKYVIDSFRKPRSTKLKTRARKEQKRRLGVIDDDSPESLNCEIAQFRAAGDRSYLLITIEGFDSPTQLDFRDCERPRPRRDPQDIIGGVCDDFGVMKAMLLDSSIHLPVVVAARHHAVNLIVAEGFSRKEAEAIMGMRLKQQPRRKAGG